MILIFKLKNLGYDVTNLNELKWIKIKIAVQTSFSKN